VEPGEAADAVQGDGMSMSENVVSRNPWMTSVMAAARKPPIIV